MLTQHSMSLQGYTSLSNDIKTIIMSGVPVKDPDEADHMFSLNRVFTIVGSDDQGLIVFHKWTVTSLIRLGGCLGLSEASLCSTSF